MRVRMLGRGRAAAIAGAATAAMLAAGLLAAGGAAAGAATTAARPTAAAPGPAGASVPWKSVGPGWALAVVEAAQSSKPQPSTLVLTSPAGAKYALYSWKALAQAPQVVAWSGDKTRALIVIPKGATSSMEQLNLQTKKVTAIKLAKGGTAITYTRPEGVQILGVQFSGSKYTLTRYTQTGALAKALFTSADPSPGFAPEVVYSSDGTMIAVAAPRGLFLVSNAGGLLRKLPVPGVAANASCVPVRWWNAGTILASCYISSKNWDQLWLIPANGAKPKALTPVRTPAGYDLGDIDAWQLTSGLYLQSLGACGTLELNKQAKNGSITNITVPGLKDGSPVVVTASSTQLLIAGYSCEGNGQLVWFNPATKAEKWLLKTGLASTVIAYNSNQNPA